MTIEFKDYPSATSIGLDFIDADGVRRVTCQLLNPQGIAYATANFANGKLVGHRARYDVELPLFWALCSKLIKGDK